MNEIDQQNRMVPSCWLRLYTLRMHVDTCAYLGATAEMYCLPALPQELLDRLDSIEPEHAAPIAEEVGEMTTSDGGRLEHYDAAPHRLFLELQEHEFMLEAEYTGGAGFLELYTSKTKPNVMYLLESDGESGVWAGVRFGHFYN